MSTLSGHNLIFPEIWSDSSYSKSFTVDIKLASPYGDRESIFLHILRPLFHLMALAIPRQVGANSYTTPLLIQAHSKGVINCEMGIVEGISITRAGSGLEQQTVDNLPTEIDVSLSIKDLYANISLTNHLAKHGREMLFNNIGLLDFIASFTGYSLNKPDPARKLDFALSTMLRANPILNWRETFWRNPKSLIQDRMRDIALRLTSFAKY
jgi:hypothetical protein